MDILTIEDGHTRLNLSSHARPTTTSEHAATRTRALIADRHIRVIDADNGTLLRELDLNPDRDYQALGRPPGPHPTHPEMQRCPETHADHVSGHRSGAPGGIRTPNLLILSRCFVSMSPGDCA